MRVTLDWLGVSTFRLVVGDLTIFLDAYIDRVPAAPPVGMTVADVAKADFILVGHSHFDHLWGAERIARRTGATVIGSHETVRLLHDKDGIPEEQLMAVAGGEPVDLGSGVRVRVFPSLHSCVWAKMSMGGVTDEPCLGDLGIAHQERALRVARGMEMMHAGALGPDVATHLKESDRLPRGEGGALAYLIETPAGSILWKDSSGHWSGILRDLRPDLALLAAVGRGNVDGEPVQGHARRLRRVRGRAAASEAGRAVPPRRLDAAADDADRRRSHPPRARAPRVGRTARGDGLPGRPAIPHLTRTT